ncbi:MAG TPA: class I SAM-dependent methyltransferase [Firmicutes bacterium]|jgi:SAM-dependent methyltransferase|nr:class I SAM-dependent methyltransferase [Bacillota bacterium]
MSKSAYNHLLPVYPLIAQQIVDDYQITAGKCVDIGTGPGYLGIELAKITLLEMYFLDSDAETLQKARENVRVNGLGNVVHFTHADVASLPFDDNFAELVISRGSLWFWSDQIKGLQEIYRILKPGGTAFVGGGLGRYTPPTMRRRLQGRGRKRLEKEGEGSFLKGAALEKLVRKTGIMCYRLIADEEGEPEHWIEIKKLYQEE